MYAADGRPTDTTSYRAWEKDGAKRSKVEILVNELEFMDRGENVQNQNAKAVQDEGILADSDIPF